MGINNAAKPPVILEPGPTPTFLYNGPTASGKPPAKQDLKKVFAATLEAAYCVNVSTR